MSDQLHQTILQKVFDKADSATTYCLGGGLAWFSCNAEKLEPILSDIGLLIGIWGCLLKAYYDRKKYLRKERKPSNDI